jgi:hypothetical protein
MSALRPTQAITNSFATAFAPNASAEDRAVLATVQRPISLACVTVPTGHPLWKDLPTWFLVAEQDHMIIPATQRFMAERMKAKIKQHAVDHGCCRHFSSALNTVWGTLTRSSQ